MKAKLLFLLCFWTIVSVQAQTRDAVIDWGLEKNSVNTFSETKTIVDNNNAAKYGSLELSENKSLFTDQWSDINFADPTSLKVFNIKYSPATSSELDKVDRSLLPKEFKATIASGSARSDIFTQIQASPIVYLNGSYQKVMSFSYSYNSLSNRNLSSQRLPITSSVLASGNFYKFKITKTGVYRLSKNFLNDLGMKTNGINPRNLKIYGHGGKPLSLLNAENTSFDLPENSIQVFGEADGSFDSSDFILFYGIGTEGYDPQNDTNLNPYDNDSFYYVTADGGAGLRVQNMVEPSAAVSTIITDFNDYQFHEEDTESPAKVGRRWFGNRFDFENEQTFEFEFPNIVSGKPVNVVVKAASASEAQTSMAISVNGTAAETLSFVPINDPFLLSTKSYEGDNNVSGETVSVKLEYNNSGNPSSIGYIDFIGVTAFRQLMGIDGQFNFQNNLVANLSGIGEYQITNAAQFTQVWDVTNTNVISAKQNIDNSAILSFKASLGSLRNYVAINPNDYFTPIAVSRPLIANQDLKGSIFKDASGNFKDVDYLIITAPYLLQPALRLANHRNLVDGLNVKVVTTDKIYEEFSSGKQDISAIRNFVRYIYENASTPSKRLKYLGIFGDTSVDYKNRIERNNNVVPTFQTLFSGSTFASFMSDDFFGNLDINEGTIGGETINTAGITQRDIDKLDVAVGRIIADDVPLANQMVDKIVAYSDKASYGNWRNNFVLISDDVDAVFEYQALEVNLDNLGDRISAEKPFINVKKIHTDAFKQQASAGGDRYPEVNEAIINATEVGALIINYFGHGGEDGLAKEFIFTRTAAENLKNRNKYPCIVTVTCEFTKFDNPQRITAGELTYWNNEGGAISLITTTRSIGVSLGVEFNKVLAAELFGYGVDIPETPAEALRIAKNQISDNFRRVVFYIGDPSMRLAFPKKSIRLTTLNGVPIGQSTDTLKALSRVRLGGEVVNESGSVLTEYNGVLEAKLFDKNVQRQTLGNDGVNVNGELLILDFKTLGEGIFNGQASINNGIFDFEFVVPRDIQIPVGKARVSLYAQKNNELENQNGVNLDLDIGGLNENAPEDNQGPLIQLFMNDESFVNGGITNDSPILIANLSDDNGLNTASGIGHDMIAILDGDESNPIVVNEYYQADVDDFTKGVNTYPLRDLEKGLHTLTFKAWDTYNNSSTQDIQFIVAGDDELKIERVLNYPNPFVNYTEFWFNHNRPFEPLEVQVQVFTVTGKVVWTKNQIVTNDGFLSRDIIWDGRDDFGDRIGKGVYVYKITVKSTLTNKQVEKFEKLVIL